MPASGAPSSNDWDRRRHHSLNTPFTLDVSSPRQLPAGPWARRRIPRPGSGGRATFLAWPVHQKRGTGGNQLASPGPSCIGDRQTRFRGIAATMSQPGIKRRRDRPSPERRPQPIRTEQRSQSNRHKHQAGVTTALSCHAAGDKPSALRGTELPYQLRRRRKAGISMSSSSKDETAKSTDSGSSCLADRRAARGRDPV